MQGGLATAATWMQRVQRCRRACVFGRGPGAGRTLAWNLPRGYCNSNCNRIPHGNGNINKFSNQSIPIDKEVETDLQRILSRFPPGIQFAFGYGSGVFEQIGYDRDSERPQIDLILAVPDPLEFHTQNLQLNPNHYSGLRWFGGSPIVCRFQEIGAGIYFNPYAQINGHQVKYGVISMARLIRDLQYWDNFYVAGRLQKPVKILRNDPLVSHWNQLNLTAAATLAKYLTLSKNNNKFDEFNFYKEITALSYLGDIRYTLGGENPNKVENIVKNNYSNFQKYYEPIYNDMIFKDLHYLPEGYTLETTTSILEKKIRRASVKQTLKGIFTAGITKSVKYAWSKKIKAWKGNYQIKK